MLAKEKLARINALAKKAKEVGLTEKEKTEQTALRKEYLAAFRTGMKHHIEGMKVIDPTGQDVTPEKLKEIQRKKGYHGRG